jgi:hypothetical protein
MSKKRPVLSKQVRLRSHGPHVWEETLVVHPDLFTDLEKGDTLEVFSAKGVVVPCNSNLSEPNKKLFAQVGLIAAKGL